jgi:GT2 family glycosyltransferase
VHDERQEVIQYAGASLHFICEAINPWSGHTLGERGGAAGDVGTAPGVAMLIDAEAAGRVGRFDARYFMGKEDGEFCYRLRLGGYRIIEVPQAIAAHGSRKRTTWLYRYQLRNRWHFMLKNYEVRTLLVLAPALLLHELLQLSVLLFQGEFHAWRHGVVALCRWLPTLRRERSVLRTVRVVHDKQLLAAAPLMVRDEIAGGSVGGALKKVYDGWLVLYWRLARLLLA